MTPITITIGQWIELICSYDIIRIDGKLMMIDGFTFLLDEANSGQGLAHLCFEETQKAMLFKLTYL